MGETAREAVTVKNERDMTAESQDASTGDISQIGHTSTVKRERLAPRMFLRLRVLLVDADDSTRRIIAALLRKCSYRVAAVPDGLRAWETLKGKPHNVDIILTEVELPSISGYALLTLIMEHEICKSIPVVMMSSKDSISLILKCMLKGAADFLIKPVRRNELRNLCQHVWRRRIQTAGNVHHSAAVAEQKVEATSGNNVTSNTSYCGLAVTETRHQVSVEESDQQGVLELCAEKFLGIANIVKYEEQRASSSEAYYSFTVEKGEDHLFTKSSVKEPISHKELACSIEELSSGTKELVKPQASIDLTGNFIKCEPNVEGQWRTKYSTENFSVSPQLKLSFGRSFPTHSKDGRNEEQYNLGHSKASAFSRYDNNKIWQPVFPTMAGLSTVSKEDANASDNHSVNQHTAFHTFWGHGTAFTNDQENLTSSRPGHYRKSKEAFGYVVVPGVRSGGHFCPPMLHAQPGYSPVSSSNSQHEQSHIPTRSSIHSTSEVQNPEQCFWSFEETANASAEEKKQANYYYLETLEAKRGVSPTCGSYDFCDSTRNNRGTAVSTSEENSKPSPHIRTTDFSERIDDSHLHANNGQKGVVSYCINQREAALIKFRLKRKDRCYEKKVRYQSRKRLAEQRPRVKGQFVRQI